mgnify:CR=1 FL=1
MDYKAYLKNHPDKEGRFGAPTTAFLLAADKAAQKTVRTSAAPFPA